MQATPDPVPEEPPPAPPSPPAREAREPEILDVVARFATAARALAFAEQAMQVAQLDRVPSYRSATDGSWWIQARLPLGPAREMAGLSTAELYVSSGSGYVRDRGWGEGPGSGAAADLSDVADRADLVEVSPLELVRAAGLHPAPGRPLPQSYVLLPGYLVPGLLERALDLRLHVTYQQVRLDSLFDADAPARFCYAVRLSAGTTATLPASLLAALRADPFALLCRAVKEQALLIGYGTASPLSDAGLGRLVEAAGDGTWLLAGPPDGCARVTWIDQPLEAANFVRLGPAHALADLDDSQPYAEPAGQATTPEPRMLSLVRAAARVVHIDALLLDDNDLSSLPLLLAGDPLADVAFLVRGAGRHLLSAPGGLLTELGLGEPLTCVGPGSVYLPVGYRLDPPVGPAARVALFEPQPSIAQVVLPRTRLAYDLDAAVPVWSLWAGPLPALDPQLSRSARAELDQVAAAVGEPAKPAERDRPSPLSRFRRQAPRVPVDIAEWRQQAQRAERDRDYVAAAQLYARNNEPLRAARMWEREAAENPDVIARSER